jgi:flagellar biosynthesis/type III secretory pathway protein FliH
MCNLSKGVEEKAMAKGLAQGLAQGLEQGLEQGVAQERMEIAKALLDILDDETIALKTGLSQEEVCHLRNKA